MPDSGVPTRLGHATFETPDLQRAIAYYTEVNGLVLVERERDAASLATSLGQLVVRLEHGAAPRCTRLSFEAPGGLADAAALLETHGVAMEERRDAVAGIGRLLTFKDPNGTTIELFEEAAHLPVEAPPRGVVPLKLGHVAFVVRDIQAVVAFYRDVLGFRVSDWIDDFFVFMRCGPDHHSVNFVSGPRVNVHHVAFELADGTHILSSCDEMARHDIPLIWGPMRHGPGHNLAVYHLNADGQVIEFYTQLDQVKDEALGCFEPRPWHRDRPQRPQVWPRESTIEWGLAPTPTFLRAREG